MHNNAAAPTQNVTCFKSEMVTNALANTVKSMLSTKVCYHDRTFDDCSTMFSQMFVRCGRSLTSNLFCHYPHRCTTRNMSHTFVRWENMFSSEIGLYFLLVYRKYRKSHFMIIYLLNINNSIVHILQYNINIKLNKTKINN